MSADTVQEPPEFVIDRLEAALGRRERDLENAHATINSLLATNSGLLRQIAAVLAVLDKGGAVVFADDIREALRS